MPPPAPADTASALLEMEGAHLRFGGLQVLTSRCAHVARDHRGIVGSPSRRRCCRPTSRRVSKEAEDQHLAYTSFRSLGRCGMYASSACWPRNWTTTTGR
jgi:hypothetical protein